MSRGRMRDVSEEEEERQGYGEVGYKLSVRGRHPISFAVHFCHQVNMRSHSRPRRHTRLGLSSLIHLFKIKLSASQPICPVNSSEISISRVAHIRVV